MSLRPGAFLDQITRMGGPVRQAATDVVRLPTMPLTYVLTADLAGYLADAVDAPDVDGQRIDIGWDRPVSMQEIAQIRAAARPADRGAHHSGRPDQRAAAVVGPFSPMVKDMGAMVRWFQTGRYMADTTASVRYSVRFPPPRTPSPGSSAASDTPSPSSP